MYDLALENRRINDLNLIYHSHVCLLNNYHLSTVHPQYYSTKVGKTYFKDEK